MRPRIRQKDKLTWTPAANGVFSIRSAWSTIRQQNSKVSWHKAIWFPKHTPHMSFVTWVAILGRLSTQDKLVSWGVASQNRCLLCSSGGESHDHLFFECPFSERVWMAVCSLISEPWQFLNFKEWLSWVENNCKGYLVYVC